MSALPVPGAIDPDHEDAIDTRPDEDELDGDGVGDLDAVLTRVVHGAPR